MTSNRSQFADDRPVVAAVDLHTDTPAMDESRDSVAVEGAPTPSGGLPPIPPAIKYGLPVLLIALVLGGFLFAQSFFEATNDDVAGLGPTPSSFDSVDAAAPGGALSSAVDQVARANTHDATDVSDEVVTDDAGDDVTGIESSLMQINSVLSGLDDRLTALQTQFSSLAAEAKRTSARIADLDGRADVLAESLSAVQSASGSLRKALSSVKHQVGRNTKALRVKARKAASRPPFQLVSVDEWGGELSAVLEFAGKSAVASVGDSPAGWTIRRIDPAGCITAVRATEPSSAPVKVCRGAR